MAFEPSVQFHFNQDKKELDEDDDEPLLQFHKENEEDDEPLLQVKQDEAEDKSTSKYDNEDLNIQPRLKDESHIQSVSSSTRLIIKVVLGIFAVCAVAALVIAFVSLIFGIAGLQKSSNTEAITQKPSTTSSPTTSESVPSTTSPPTKPPPVLVQNADCGAGLWNKIVHLNMSDRSQECPHGWRGYDGPVRCCGRPVISRSSTASVYFSTNGYKYSKVCGKAIGYQQGSPDCFANYNRQEPDTETVDGIYVDGVSVTHGNPRTHIWTFAVGLRERSNTTGNGNNCPCDGGTNPPDFVENNYFCETGDDTPNVELNRFFGDDPLWDGQDCHDATCCSFNSPPWFRVQLPNPTMNDIEVRILGDQSTGDEDSPIAYLEIYVQT